MSAAIVEAFVIVKYTGNSQLTELLSFQDLAFGCDETPQVPYALVMANCTHRCYVFGADTLWLKRLLCHSISSSLHSHQTCNSTHFFF